MIDGQVMFRIILDIVYQLLQFQREVWFVPLTMGEAKSFWLSVWDACLVNRDERYHDLH